MKNMHFEGSGFEYFKIWIVNILLVILTLSIYYPWAKVRSRRYFYGNSTLEGRNFEYHATGKDLLIGYLLSLGILIAYGVVQSVSVTGSVVIVVAFFLAVPWIIWRSLLFNMHATSFSNVRFGFDGALPQAYINFMVLPIAIFLTLYVIPVALIAITTPFFMFGKIGPGSLTLAALCIIACWLLSGYLIALMKKRNTCYTINHARYGQGQFSVNVETPVFVKILLKTIGLTLLGFVIYLAAAALASKQLFTTEYFQQLGNLGDIAQNPALLLTMLGGNMLIIIAALYLMIIVGSLSAMAYMYARQRRYILTNSRLDENITLQSTLKARTMAWVMISNFFIVIFSIGLAFPWAKVRMARTLLENTLVDTDQGFDDYISQQQQASSPLGDQLGDALNIDAGIAL
ncbi:MAG: DUF898 domain-containing protein [Cellvibrionaceae bacterium]|nr:DUF898 domain-containing protein [Cellvibrionaceae bacterium]